MAHLEKYQTHVENLIKAYARYKPAYGEMENQVIFDREHNHYYRLYEAKNDAFSHLQSPAKNEEQAVAMA